VERREEKREETEDEREEVASDGRKREITWALRHRLCKRLPAVDRFQDARGFFEWGIWNLAASWWSRRQKRKHKGCGVCE
jgi:hypothetical protein